MSRPAAARRPRTPGAHVKPGSASLVLELAPSTGVKAALLDVKRRTGIPAKEIAARALIYCRDHFEAIATQPALPPLPGVGGKINGDGAAGAS